jgi:hypothetical protein
MGPVSTSHEVEDIAFSSLEVMYTPDSIRRRGWHVWRTIINEFLNSRTHLASYLARYSGAISSIHVRLLVGGSPSIVTVIVLQLSLSPRQFL